MKSNRRLHLKTFVLILLMVVFGPLGDVLLSKGMKQIGALPDWSAASLAHLFTSAFTSGLVWLGIGFLLAFFISYMLVLSWADYSFVQPASALGYAVVALLGYLLLDEHISPIRWIGVLTICLGVLLVGHTSPRTTVTGD
jgi:drug/metabolite transporter (DMT)-like permease